MPDPGRDLISPAQHYKSRRVGPRSGTIMRAQLGGGHNICIILFYFSLWATNSAIKKMQIKREPSIPGVPEISRATGNGRCKKGAPAQFHGCEYHRTFCHPRLITLTTFSL